MTSSAAPEVQQEADTSLRVARRRFTTRASQLGTRRSRRSPVLTNPVAACSRLQVVLRVEVAVHEDDGVSGGEVQADAPCKDNTTDYLHTHIYAEQVSCTHPSIPHSLHPFKGLVLTSSPHK